MTRQHIDLIKVVPVISATPYANGDALGGKFEIPGVALDGTPAGLITSLVVIDKAVQFAGISLVLFDRDFTETADNAPFAISDADIANCIGVLTISPRDYRPTANNLVACLPNISMPYVLAAPDWANNGGKLFGQATVDDKAPTFAVGDLIFKFGVTQY